MRMKTASSALLQTLLATSLALAGDMSLGPTTPAAAVKGHNQFSPTWLAAFDRLRARQRRIPGVWQRSQNYAGRIECARLDATGKPLDPKPLVIAPDARWQEAPRVAFGNNVYLVVWQDLRDNRSSTSSRRA